MLFTKMEQFSSSWDLENCIVKPFNDAVDMYFNGSRWYIFHFDDFDLLDDRFYCESEPKQVVETSSNGVTDGIIDARSAEGYDFKLTISGKCIIMLADSHYDGIIRPDSNARVKIDSNKPVYKNIQKVFTIKRDRVMLRDWLIWLASTYNLSVYDWGEGLHLGCDETTFYLGSETKGIKTGQFIL